MRTRAPSTASVYLAAQATTCTRRAACAGTFPWLRAPVSCNKRSVVDMRATVAIYLPMGANFVHAWRDFDDPVCLLKCLPRRHNTGRRDSADQNSCIPKVLMRRGFVVPTPHHCISSVSVKDQQLASPERTLEDSADRQ